jgi:hypothetical protein
MTIVDQLPVPSDITRAVEQVPALAAVSPEEFEFQLEQAHKKAKILASIVENPANPLYTTIQGNKHLHVEAWKTIGKGYGYTPHIEWTRERTDGGWEARAVFLDLNGIQVGSGEAECGTRGDTTWEGRASYQQRSMAQTRAISRAGRNTLDWVVVLAGYSATPHEEMTAVFVNDGDVARPRQSSPSNHQQQQNSTQELCPEHNTDWFQRGNMKSPAHPVNGSDGKQLLDENGRPQWCNMGYWMKRLGERSIVIRENMPATEGNAWVKEFIATDNPGKWDMIRSAEERASRDEPLFEEPAFDDFEPSR